MDPDMCEAWEITGALPPVSTFAAKVEAAFPGDNPIVCDVREGDATSMVFLFTSKVSGKRLGGVLSQCVKGTDFRFALTPLADTPSSSKQAAINAAMTLEILALRRSVQEERERAAEQKREFEAIVDRAHEDTKRLIGSMAQQMGDIIMRNSKRLRPSS